MKKQLRADIILLAVTMIWGLSFPLMRNLLADLPAVPFLAVRFTLAAVILTAVFFQKLKKLNGIIIIQGVIIGFFLFLGMILQVFGLYSTTASNSAFITGMNVVMVPVFLALFFRRKTDKYAIYGIFLATAGLLLISGVMNTSLNPGDVLTFFCAASFAFQIIFIDKFTKKSDPILIGVVQIWTAALLNLAVWGLVDRSPMVYQPNVLLIIAYTGILGTALAFMVQTVIQKDTTPSHAALIFTSEPVFGAIFAMVIADAFGRVDTMSWVQVAGAFLILAGMAVSEFKIISEAFKKKWKTS
ncbi:MAG: DMT family transporter [Clostridia bacterium]